MIQLEVTFKVAQTEVVNFADAARKVARASRAENGCEEYVFGTDLDSMTMFHLLEQWESEAALQQHYQSAHFLEFAAYLGSIGCERTRRARIGDFRELQMKPRSA